MRELMDQSVKRNDYDKYVTYREGAARYKLGLNKFMEMAHDANACYKVGKRVIVNCEIFEKYLESFRLVQ